MKSGESTVWAVEWWLVWVNLWKLLRDGILLKQIRATKWESISNRMSAVDLFTTDSMVKDLSMIHRALRDRGHEEATRISQCTARSAQGIDVSEWPLSASDLTMHDTSCLNPIITLIIWFWYIMKPKFTSEVPKREVASHALWKIYAWFCRSRA